MPDLTRAPEARPATGCVYCSDTTPLLFFRAAARLGKFDSGSPTPHSNPSSCVADPCAAERLHPWFPARRPPLNALGTRCSSLRCRAAQSISSRRWLPTWWRRSRSSCLSAIPLAPLAAAPSQTLPDAWPRPSAGGCARWSHDPASSHPARSARTAANTKNPPPAKRCLSRSRSLQRNLSASPGSTSPELETGGPASRDRTGTTGFAELVEACLIQYFVQPPIERMARSFREIPAIPQLLLSLTPPTCSHRHALNLTLDRLSAK
jgi:hypothetical protein